MKCGSLVASDVIFITVGSNDLMTEFKNVVREILETDVKFKAVDKAMDVLSQSMAENPVANLELPSTMNRMAEDIILNMDEIIDRYGDEYGYQVADVYNSDICEHVQEGGGTLIRRGSGLSQTGYTFTNSRGYAEVLAFFDNAKAD